MRETEKIVDAICMEIQQSETEGEDGSNTLKEHTSTKTTEASSEDESSKAEV